MRRNAMHTLESTYMSWDGAVNCMWRRDRQVGGRMRICMNWYWHWSILNRTCDCDRCTTWPYVTAYSCILITLTTRTGNKHKRTSNPWIQTQYYIPTVHWNTQKYTQKYTQNKTQRTHIESMKTQANKWLKTYTHIHMALRQRIWQSVAHVRSRWGR